MANRFLSGGGVARLPAFMPGPRCERVARLWRAWRGVVAGLLTSIFPHLFESADQRDLLLVMEFAPRSVVVAGELQDCPA